MRVHDVRAGQCHADALGRGPVTCAALSRDGRVVAAACMSEGASRGDLGGDVSRGGLGGGVSRGLGGCGVVALLEKATGQVRVP